MASDSVGKIGLDLVVNKNGFDKQMAGITKLAKKAGAALAAAFTVKKIIDFGAACIELGSDLEEVQNVVDVTFPQMSRQVDEFAKNAAKSFGLSETMAKRFTGTFGAMAKAFGFNEQAAYEMSTTLTGLAGDVASFYNITQDEAYTKLKSVFTGETESLKDLGVVMTQNALDAYAMANGFGKTTSAMSEMEKVALRYQFAQDQLSASAGDFVRTSDSWANQVRILKLQFDSLKATIGQGLINVLTPVIKVINTIIGKLMSLANAFRSFTELITGKKNGGVSAAAAGMDAVASAADQAGSATSAAGNAAKKAAKDIKGITTGIDELNIIDQGTDDTGSGSAGAGAAGGTFSLGQADTSVLDEADSKYQKLIDRLKELAALAKSGFWDAFGDVSVFDSIQGSIDSIRQSLAEIFTAPEVMSAADGFAESVAYNLGRIAGAVASVGATVADVFLGAIDRYLEKNKDFIKNKVKALFDIGNELFSIAGDAAQAIAEIFAVLRTEDFKRIGANIFEPFSNTVLNILELLGRVGTDILKLFVQPIVNSKNQIIKTLLELAAFFAPLTGVIADTVTFVGQEINDFYTGIISPVFDSIISIISGAIDTIVKVFEEWFAPALRMAREAIESFRNGPLNEIAGNFDALIGNISELTQTILNGLIVVLNQYLKPLVDWFIEQAAPIISSVLQGAIGIFISLATKISEVITSILAVLNGLLKFLTGIFTGNWKLAWEGVQEIFRGVWEMMKAIVNAATNIINSVITAAWNLAKAKTTAIWNSIKTILSGIWNALKALATAVFEAIKTIIYIVWEAVSAKTSEIWEAIKNALQSLWNTVKNTAAAVFEAIRTIIYTAWEAVKAKTSEIWEAIKNALQSLWNTVKNTASNTFTAIKDAIVNAWTEVKNQTKQIWDGIWGIIKGVINSIIGGVESMANRVIDGINSIIEGINDLVGPLADFVNLPSIPKLRRVKLPRLAQGGFVRANTPQLAMIGDNRHYGEIVAPEDKMQEMVNRAAALAAGSGGMSDQHLVAMIELLQRIIELIENLDLTVSIDIREIRKKLIDLEKRSGYTLRTT